MSDWQLNTPVCFLIFNRPEITNRVFQAIRVAKPPQLFVVADGARTERPGEKEKCLAAREIINHVDWDCEVLTNFSDANLGCRKRVSSGLDWLFSHIDEAIILEDDCLPHPTFFRFCETLLHRYRDDPRIMLISGQNLQLGQKRRHYSYYFSRYNHCWGWASWKRAWQHYDDSMKLWPKVRDEHWLYDLLENEHAFRYWSATFQRLYEGFDTWDYPWLFACWINQGLTVLPNVNLVSNLGFGAEATHTKNPDTILANMAVEEILFPLKHPPFVIRDTQADKFTESNYYSGTAPKEKKARAINVTRLLDNTLTKVKNGHPTVTLNNTTLVAISSKDIQLALLSLAISNLHVSFGTSLFFTSQDIPDRYLERFPQLTVVKIEPIESLNDYSRFVIKELTSFVDTDFCLITQGDGFIVNPQYWSDDFFNYDYVGAPWRKQTPLTNARGETVDILDLRKNRVGNGGFSLRSKKLLQVSSQLNFDDIETLSLSEDLIICHYYYDWFKDRGINFAPLDIASKFSFEQPIEEIDRFSWEQTFGFHGKPTLYRVLTKMDQDIENEIRSAQREPC